MCIWVVGDALMVIAGLVVREGRGMLRAARNRSKGVKVGFFVAGVPKGASGLKGSFHGQDYHSFEKK